MNHQAYKLMLECRNEMEMTFSCRDEAKFGVVMWYGESNLSETSLRTKRQCEGSDPKGVGHAERQ